MDVRGTHAAVSSTYTHRDSMLERTMLLHSILLGARAAGTGPSGRGSGARQAPKPHRCPQCSDSFATRPQLVSHMSLHLRGIPLKPYRCEQCGKEYSTDSALATHKRLHSDYKAFACSHCSKRFHRKDHCRNHELCVLSCLAAFVFECLRVRATPSRPYLPTLPPCSPRFTCIVDVLRLAVAQPAWRPAFASVTDFPDVRGLFAPPAARTSASARTSARFAHQDSFRNPR